MENSTYFIGIILFIEIIFLYYFFSWLNKKIQDRRKKDEIEFWEKVEKPFIEEMKKLLKK